MSHPPEHLLADLAQVLLAVDAEAAVHLEFCDACTPRFSLAFTEVLNAGEPPQDSAAGPAPLPRQSDTGRDAARMRRLHPSDDSIVGFARTFLAMNEKVFDHARQCSSCLWKVTQTVATRASRRETCAETTGAVGFVAELGGLAPAEREARVLSAARLQPIAVAESLRREAGHWLASDPGQAEEFARLALLATGASATDGRSADLLAGAWADLGEARRRQGDLAGAEKALDIAAFYRGSAETTAERWFFLAELRRSQEKVTEALALYERAEGCFASCGEVECQAVAGMRTAVLHFAEGRAEEAAGTFGRLCPLAGHGLPAVAVLRAALGKYCALTSAGHGEEAARMAKQHLLCLAAVVRSPFLPRDQTWAEAVIDGQIARERLPAVLAENLAEGGPWEAALVALDLAAVLVDNGASGELARVAAEVRPLTLPGGLPPPGRGLVERVLSAIEEGSATAQQIRHAADAVALCWNEPELALGA
jgi:tetratricopeptide (TPR) repeat protein